MQLMHPQKDTTLEGGSIQIGQALPCCVSDIHQMTTCQANLAKMALQLQIE